MKNKSRMFIPIIMWVVSIAYMVPLYWLLISSLKSDLEMSQTPPTLFPKAFQFSNFTIVWEQLKLHRAFLNSIFISTLTTLMILLFASLAGYVLSKKKIAGKKIIFTTIIATMIVPPTVLMLPLYAIIKSIGLYDNIWGLILPFSVTTFGIFFMKQYIDDIPNDLIECSRIDGAGEFKIFFSVIIPLIKPGLATLAIIEFVSNWNSFIMPLVLLNSSENFTIPLRIAELTRATDVTSTSLVLAANLLSIIPVVLVFLFAQKWFIKGVMEGSVKG